MIPQCSVSLLTLTLQLLTAAANPFFFFVFCLFVFFSFDFASLPESSERKNAKSIRKLCTSAGHQKFKKWRKFNFFFFKIYYATADILVNNNNFPSQEDSCRCNLAVVRLSYGFLNFKKYFKALDVPAGCKQIASTGCYCHGTFYKKRLYKQTPEYLRSRAQPRVGK